MSHRTRVEVLCALALVGAAIAGGGCTPRGGIPGVPNVRMPEKGKSPRSAAEWRAHAEKEHARADALERDAAQHRAAAVDAEQRARAAEAAARQRVMHITAGVCFLLAVLCVLGVVFAAGYRVKFLVGVVAFVLAGVASLGIAWLLAHPWVMWAALGAVALLLGGWVVYQLRKDRQLGDVLLSAGERAKTRWEDFRDHMRGYIPSESDLDRYVDKRRRQLGWTSQPDR